MPQLPTAVVMKFIPLKMWYQRQDWKVKGMLFLLVIILSIFIGQFFSKTSWLSDINPLIILFGKENVDINPNLNPIKEGPNSTIRITLTNIGDKTLDDVEVAYFPCSSKEWRVDSGIKKLNKEEPIDFDIVMHNQSFNRSCNPIPRVNLPLYFDEKGNCYAEALSEQVLACHYCNLTINVYNNQKLIKNELIWYPYMESYILISISDLGGCFAITNKTNLSTLRNATIGTSLVDIATLCKENKLPIKFCRSIKQ